MITTSQIFFAVTLVFSPIALAFLIVLWRDGAFSPPLFPPEILIEDRLAYDLQEISARINAPLASPEAVAARVRLIMACRIILQATGFQVGMERKPLFIEDDGAGK